MFMANATVNVPFPWILWVMRRSLDFFNLVPSLKLTAKVYLNMDGVEDEKWLWEKKAYFEGRAVSLRGIGAKKKIHVLLCILEFFEQKIPSLMFFQNISSTPGAEQFFCGRLVDQARDCLTRKILPGHIGNVW